MKLKLLAMSIISILCSIFGCKAQGTSGFETVSVDRFEQTIADTSVVRLDVRTPDEYAEGHIAGAVNIDVTANGFDQKASTLPKDRTIALYCRSGRRSKKAAQILAQMGYKVVELESGIIGWTSAGKETTK